MIILKIAHAIFHDTCRTPRVVKFFHGTFNNNLKLYTAFCDTCCKYCIFNLFRFGWLIVIKFKTYMNIHCSQNLF